MFCFFIYFLYIVEIVIVVKIFVGLFVILICIFFVGLNYFFGSIYFVSFFFKSIYVDLGKQEFGVGLGGIVWINVYFFQIFIGNVYLYRYDE